MKYLYSIFLFVFYLSVGQDLLRVDGELITTPSRPSDIIIQIYRVVETTDSIMLSFEKEILIHKHKKESHFTTYLPTLQRYLWEYTKDNILMREYLDLSLPNKDKAVQISSDLKSEQSCKTVMLKIVDFVTAKPIEAAAVTLKWQEVKITTKTFKTDSTAQVQVLIPIQVANFLIEVSKKNYHTNVDLYSNSNIIIKLKKLDPSFKFHLNETFKLRNTKFKVNSYDLIREKSNLSHLDTLINFLKFSPDINILLTCHTDARGNETYNLKLSQKRADVLKNYLERQGIEAQRIKAVGLGETKLLNHCSNGIYCSNDGHVINRRVEVKLYK